MKIEKNKVALIHYTLTDADGEQIDSSREREPVAYLHGANNIVPGLEKALEGREAGDSFEVSVPPEQAYGNRDDARLQRISAKLFGDRRKLEPGMEVMLRTRGGPVHATIVKVGRFHVDVDTNHPLAGKELHFDVEVMDVRDATREEIQHGHAHGPGGHDHG